MTGGRPDSGPAAGTSGGKMVRSMADVKTARSGFSTGGSLIGRVRAAVSRAAAGSKAGFGAGMARGSGKGMGSFGAVSGSMSVLMGAAGETGIMAAVVMEDDAGAEVMAGAMLI